MTDFQSTPWGETYDRESPQPVSDQLWRVRRHRFAEDEGVMLESDASVAKGWSDQRDKTLALVKEWFHSVHGYTGEIKQGKKANGNSCVIHNTLAARYGDRVGLVVSTTYEIDNGLVRILPPNITKFVRMFDSGLYPELEA